MTRSTPDALAALTAYLHTNREFVAPAVEEAVRSLRVPDGARVLDAGTGAGGGLVALANAAADVRVLAVDLNPAVIELAAEHATRSDVHSGVTYRTANLLDVTAEATFDVIWASDLVWPGNFDDPADTVRRLAAALTPDGVLALFYSNYYQSMFLPGHSRLERALRTASELRWGLPGDGPTHYERHVAWLVAAGLNVELRVFPRIGFPVDADPSVRPYLESAVWPELRRSAASHGRAAGMSDADIATATELLTPGGPRYVLDDPGYYLVHPTILATGRR
jgi:SAM-dependent methyltransferase